jgi:hypothetical protein
MHTILTIISLKIYLLGDREGGDTIKMDLSELSTVRLKCVTLEFGSVQ